MVLWSFAPCAYELKLAIRLTDLSLFADTLLPSILARLPFLPSRFTRALPRLVV